MYCDGMILQELIHVKYLIPYPMLLTAIYCDYMLSQELLHAKGLILAALEYADTQQSLP
jgi:hypothetical protein